MKTADIEVGKKYAACLTKKDILARRCVEVVEVAIYGRSLGHMGGTFRSTKPNYVRVKQIAVEGFATVPVAKWQNQSKDGTQVILARYVIEPWEVTAEEGKPVMEARNLRAKENAEEEARSGRLAEAAALALEGRGVAVSVRGGTPNYRVEITGTKALMALLAVLGADHEVDPDRLPENLKEHLEHWKKHDHPKRGGMYEILRLRRMGLGPTPSPRS